jgi:hypothetical protein
LQRIFFRSTTPVASNTSTHYHTALAAKGAPIDRDDGQPSWLKNAVSLVSGSV